MVKYRIDANIKWNLIHRKMVKEQKRMVYDLRHPQLRPRGEPSKLAQWPESPNFVHQLSCLFLLGLFLKEKAKIPQKTLIKGTVGF